MSEKYDTFREAGAILNNRHSERYIHNETVRKLLNKFMTFGNLSNEFSNKRQKRLTMVSWSLT